MLDPANAGTGKETIAENYCVVTNAGSTMVELSTLNPKFKGLNPVTNAAKREKIEKTNVILLVFQVIHLEH